MSEPWQLSVRELYDFWSSVMFLLLKRCTFWQNCRQKRGFTLCRESFTFKFVINSTNL